MVKRVAMKLFTRDTYNKVINNLNNRTKYNFSFNYHLENFTICTNNGICIITYTNKLQMKQRYYNLDILPDYERIIRSMR